MVLLRKPGKIKELGICPVGDCSCVLLTEDCKSWISRNVPCEFAVGSKASTDEVVLDLLARFPKSGFLLTLDYCKAFDRLNTFVTEQLLLRLGWPAPLWLRCSQPFGVSSVIGCSGVVTFMIALWWPPPCPKVTRLA